MKRTTLWIGLGLLLFSSCSNLTETQLQYIDYVNPFVGTGGHGHTFPGPVAPHGMIQPSPDTRIYGWDACSGYHYSDSTINGFSHTHLSGTGCGDYGDVLLMPTVGKQNYRYLGDGCQQTAYASPFSHYKEVAKPGYYSVELDRYNVTAELTATPRAALHRYRFPESKEAGFIVDLDYSLQGQENIDMKLAQRYRNSRVEKDQRLGGKSMYRLLHEIFQTIHLPYRRHGHRYRARWKIL